MPDAPPGAKCGLHLPRWLAPRELVTGLQVKEGAVRLSWRAAGRGLSGEELGHISDTYGCTRWCTRFRCILHFEARI